MCSPAQWLKLRPLFLIPMLAVAALAGGGCASLEKTAPRPRSISTALSPVAEPVAPRDAWRFAETYVREHADCEVLVGSGDSMQPLYADRTVLVVQHLRTSALREGMTVVFTGDQGRPVAHTLYEKTQRGWRAIGVGNASPDETLVRRDNLVGVVVKAYAPVAQVARVQGADGQ